MRSYEKAVKGEKLAGSVAYLQVRWWWRRCVCERERYERREKSMSVRVVMSIPETGQCMCGYVPLTHPYSTPHTQTPSPPQWRVSRPEDLLDAQVQREAWQALLATRVKAASEQVGRGDRIGWGWGGSLLNGMRYRLDATKHEGGETWCGAD